MTIDEFLVDDIPSECYGERNFYFWVTTVIDATELLGPDTDNDLMRLSRLLLNYYTGGPAPPEIARGMNYEIVRLGVDISGRNRTPLAAKYRCIWAIGFSRETNLADLYNWQSGVLTAFQNINNHDDNDEAIIALIREKAIKYGVDLYATNVC